MATNKQIGYGSQGSYVTEIQKLLNENGYNLATDGIYGDKTMAAVKDYQKKNNLAVDGIVGNNTRSALTGGNTKQPAPSTGAATTPPASTLPQVDAFTYDPFKVSDSTAAADQNRQDVASQKPGEFSYGAYEKSDIVQQAEELLQQHLANNPGEYTSAWQAQLDDTLNRILNREKFSYDLNGDALYQQYKDQYMLQGQQAMMDTMGQAAAMTGGYGNSYAQTVGQQTYQGHLQQLNDRVPELYQLALNQYNREGDELYNQYAMFADRENQDYGRYRDTKSDYYADLDRLTEDARYQSETDYGRWTDGYNMAYGQHRDTMSDYYTDLNRADSEYWNQYNRDYGQYSDDRNFAYGQYSDDRNHTYDNYWNEQSFNYQKDRDQKADEQWQATFDEGVRQFNIANDVDTGSSSNGSGGGDNPSTGGRYDAEAARKQQILRDAGYDVAVDGIWGPQSTAAWEKYEKVQLSPTNRPPVVPGTGGSGFTGSTYNEATAYLKEHGLSTGGLMTQSEWQRHKNGNNSEGGEHEANSYQEYLAAYIYGKTK